MKSIASCLFLTLFTFTNGLLAQNIELSVCDTLPRNFYKKNYKRITISNGMGYCNPKLKRLDDRITQFTNLEALTYIDGPVNWDDEIAGLPSGIGQLSNLKELTTNVPTKEIFELSGLTHLTLHIYTPESLALLIDYGVENLKNLTFLSLRFSEAISKNYTIKGINQLNNLKQVILFNPNQQVVRDVQCNAAIEKFEVGYSKGVLFNFSQMSNLKSVTLNNNELENIDESLYDCLELEELIITDNKISRISDGIGNLTQLRTLILWHNELNYLSNELSKCRLLKSLRIQHNGQLKKLPADIGQLNQLERLQADHCGLTELPLSFNQCVKIKSLQLDHNKLERLDIDFSVFKQLTVLFLQHNLIREVSPYLFQSAYIEKLNLANNRLVNLPNSIGNMHNLTSLELYNNKITSLPEDIGTLKKLELISAYNNQITHLPESIVNATKLNQFYVGDNQLKQLPANFEKLTQIKQLEIQNNPLTVFPACIYKMKNLERVWLSANQTTLPGYKAFQKKPDIVITD